LQGFHRIRRRINDEAAEAQVVGVHLAPVYVSVDDYDASARRDVARLISVTRHRHASQSRCRSTTQRGTTRPRQYI
jgi:hypothetical protein